MAGARSVAGAQISRFRPSVPRLSEEKAARLERAGRDGLPLRFGRAARCECESSRIGEYPSLPR